MDRLSVSAIVRQLRPFHSAGKHCAVRKSRAFESMRPRDVAHTETRSRGTGVAEIIVNRDRAGLSIELEHEQPAVLASRIQDDPASDLIPREPMGKLIRPEGKLRHLYWSCRIGDIQNDQTTDGWNSLDPVIADDDGNTTEPSCKRVYHGYHRG
jgi:hypothetical protein